MPNDKWLTPDIEETLKQREGFADPDPFLIGYHSMNNFPLRSPDEVQIGEDQYIIDPDYYEVLNCSSFDDLIKYKK